MAALKTKKYEKKVRWTTIYESLLLRNLISIFFFLGSIGTANFLANSIALINFFPLALAVYSCNFS